MSDVRDNFDLDEKLDYLALQYSRTQNEDVLTDLVTEMIPICKRDARSWSLKTGIPESDLQSAFIQTVEEAAREYRAVGLFIKRYHFFKNREAIDVLRHATAKKRDSLNTISLNSMVNNTNEEGLEFVDTIEDFSSEFSTLIELKDMMKQFKEKNPIYAKIIESLAMGKNKKEIALSLGESSYSDLARKKVSLARKTFREFIQ
jgi:hypothetical protein